MKDVKAQSTDPILERRRRQVVCTAGSQYYLHGRLCVAVRDIHSGVLCFDHPAVGAELLGRLQKDGANAWVWESSTQACVGSRLHFSSHLVTSPVLSMARPRLQVRRHHAGVRLN